MEIYKEARQIVDEIISLCGTKDIEDTASEMEEEGYQEYEDKCGKLTEAIVAIVREQEAPFDFGEFSDLIQDKGFWKKIARKVEGKTANFLHALLFRKLDKDRRLELLDRAFHLIYFQHENLSFLREDIGDEELAKALYEIIQASEDMMVLICASKRRVKKYLAETYCLEEQDSEYICELYERNIQAVRELASAKSMVRLERKINYLKQRLDGMEEVIGLLLEMQED